MQFGFKYRAWSREIRDSRPFSFILKSAAFLFGKKFDDAYFEADVRSKRSRFMTLFHAAIKSCRNFSRQSSQA